MIRKTLFAAWGLLLSFMVLQGSGIIPAIVPAAVPTANKQGNSSLFQLASGAFTNSHCLQYDSNGNAVDSGAGCGGGAASGITSSGSPLLPNAAAVSAITGHVGSGDTDIYTVPNGKKALCTGLLIYNDSGSSITAFPELKISSTYYRVVNSVTVNSAFANVYFVLSAGQSISVNVNTASVANIFPAIIQFDASGGLSSAFLTSFTAGDNTLYTSVGNSVVLSAANGSANFLFFGLTRAGEVNYYNNSGTTRTTSGNCITSGGSPSGSNKILAASTVGSPGFGGFACNALGPGDFININVDSTAAGQIAWVNVATF